MTKQQNNLIASWVVGIPTLMLSLYAVNYWAYGSWIIIFITGFGICKFLRKDIEIVPWRPFEVMSKKASSVSAIYYLCLLFVVLYVVLVKPELVSYSSISQFLLLLLLVFLPMSPVVLKRELYIFHLAGKNNA